MRSSIRRTKRRERSKAVAVLGNLLLIIATLAVVGLVAYLVLNPPGSSDATGSDSPLPTLSSGSTAPGSGVPPTTPIPPPAATTAASSSSGNTVPEGQLALDTACAALNPLLDRADDVRNQAIEDANAVDPVTVSDLTRELNTVAEISPSLTEPIDQLNQVLVDLNNELLAGADFPDVDNAGAEAATTQMRELCS
ncbi:MAG: hypothetical protein H0T85_08005 [Geodermatophilaceae bacterium]|nr:hypothetical protein [Geodermatophilaceae bacterium]